RLPQEDSGTGLRRALVIESGGRLFRMSDTLIANASCNKWPAQAGRLHCALGFPHQERRCHMDASLRMALLIDADNAPAAKIDMILAELARHGVANVRRAYGNWKSAHLQKWEQMLHPHAIQPMQQFAYSTGKNASDMAI